MRQGIINDRDIDNGYTVISSVTVRSRISKEKTHCAYRSSHHSTETPTYNEAKLIHQTMDIRRMYHVANIDSGKKNSHLSENCENAQNTWYHHSDSEQQSLNKHHIQHGNRHRSHFVEPKTCNPHS